MLWDIAVGRGIGNVEASIKLLTQEEVFVMGMILESIRNTVIAGIVITVIVALVAPMIAG